MDNPKRILVVMDALKEVSIELLELVFKNFTLQDNYTITLLGVMPWLNLPISAKTRPGIWSMDLGDLFTVEENTEWKNNPNYENVQSFVDLCQKYKVAPEIKFAMGHPLRVLVVEEITSLQATLVVFDRHHNKKNMEYYAEKVTCNIVVVNENGEIDLIKKR